MKKKSKNTNMFHIEADRLMLILALVGVISVAAVIGFIMGIVASPLDFDPNLPGQQPIGGRR